MTPFTTAQLCFPDSLQPYTYKVPLEWPLQVGSKVVVESRGKFVVVDVLGVDRDPRPPDARFDYKWAVSFIDVDSYRSRQKEL